MSSAIDIILNGISKYFGVIVGGLIAFISGFAMDYYRSKREKKDRFDRTIKKIYLDDCIVQIRNELAYYGSITMKIMNQVMRNLPILKGEEDFRKYISELKKRSETQKIISYEFQYAHSRTSYLYVFSDKFSWSIQYLFWWYSGFLDDLLNEARMIEYLRDDKLTSIVTSITNSTNMIQSLKNWYEKKLVNIESILRENNYETYADFKKILETDEMTNIINDISGLHEVYQNEEKKRNAGEEWGQAVSEYLKGHP